MLREECLEYNTLANETDSRSCTKSDCLAVCMGISDWEACQYEEMTHDCVAILSFVMDYIIRNDDNAFCYIPGNCNQY